ncbi:MAG TPA: hypothetical protein VKR22_04260, partial [Acidimicrobiales bacterium]|nr:hypothetical protein [Acidimicrobiales bacterium]
LSRVVRVSDETGVHAVVLEPLNRHVRKFYADFGMRPLPTEPERMYIPVKEVREWLKARAPELLDSQ